MHETVQCSVAATLLKNGGVLMVQVDVQLLEQTKSLLGITSLFFKLLREDEVYRKSAVFNTDIDKCPCVFNH